MARRPRSSRRRLPFFQALFPYLGGKRRLCPLIFREIDRLLPRRHWRGRTFLDGFLGGGSVSLYAKAQGFNVVATDIAERAITVGRALIENSRVRLTREDVLRLLQPSDAPPGRIEHELVPAVFTANLGRFLDRALAVADESADPAKAALIRMLAIRAALAAHPMSQVRKGTIHRVTTGEFESITESCLKRYVQEGLRLTRLDTAWSLARQINGGVFAGEGRVLKQSVLDVLPTVEADVAYFDPPYPGVMSYEREYKVIDLILEGATRVTSPFTARDGAAMIDGLFERAGHIPIWLLSLGNEVVTIGELEEKMRCLGRETRSFEIRHQHLPAIATEEKKERNREFLVVGWDTEAALLRERSVGIDGPDQVVVPDDRGVAVELEPHRGRAEAPAVARGLGDAEDELQPGLPDERGLLALSDPVPELQHGIDRPHAVLVKRCIDGDAEVGMDPPIAHSHRLAPTGPGVNSETKETTS